MKIYKDKQFLVFDFEDGKTVKYDFATRTAIGKNGKPVQNLKTQLKGMNISYMISCCEDAKYGKFLRFIKAREESKGSYINNIGTILERVPQYKDFEQIFSAGVEDIVGSHFKYTINDIPKGLIKLCQIHSIKLSNEFLEDYKKNPDAFLLPYNLEYVSLNDNDILTVLSYSIGYYNRESGYLRYINEYGCTAKAFMLYLDYLKTYEALEISNKLLNEITDYYSMMKQISLKFDKYPRHFLTTHAIASRNYNRLKKQFAENGFQKRINKDMEKTFGKYCFIYPNSTQDIKDEAVCMNNCVASYIQRVIDGRCHILFLRYKEKPDESLVTIEVRNNKIVQALQKFNNPLTSEQQEVVDKWNMWWANKIKKNESEELKYAV